MDRLIKQFITAQKDLSNAISEFPPDKREDKLFGDWDLKDVIAHFAAWNIFFTDILKKLKGDEPAPYWGNINEFNHTQVNIKRDWSWNKTYNELVKSGEQFIEEYSNTPTSLQNALFWKGKTYTPVKILKVNIHHYQKAQLQEIKKLLKEWCS